MTLIIVASRSPHETSNPDVGCVRYARTRFLFKQPQFRRRAVNCCPRSTLELPEKVQAAFQSHKTVQKQKALKQQAVARTNLPP